MFAAVLSSALLALGSPQQAERPLTVAAPGGARLAATLTVPAGAGPHPAAVVVNGFGPNDRDGRIGGRGRTTYRTIANGLAARGVAVLRYDKRGIGGSTGSDLAWLDARPLVSDVVTVTAALARRPEVDPRRITIIGHSQGGDLALWAARRAPARRVVTLSAPGRPLRALPRVPGAAQRLLLRLAGRAVVRATLDRDPVADAVRVRRPVLLVHAADDRTVPIGDMARLAAARRRAGLPTRTLRVPAPAGHFLEGGGRIAPRVLGAVAAFARG
ncbi:MAG: alpha/beta hydrolase family protein [Thermoleophilia bacterium]